MPVQDTKPFTSYFHLIAYLIACTTSCKDFVTVYCQKQQRLCRGCFVVLLGLFWSIKAHILMKIYRAALFLYPQWVSSCKSTAHTGTWLKRSWVACAFRNHGSSTNLWGHGGMFFFLPSTSVTPLVKRRNISYCCTLIITWYW